MSATHVRFLALTPDPRFAAAVKKYKARVREAVGSQLYLDDPPHLTIYLAVFDDTERLLERLARELGDIPTPRAEVTGWHVFANDALTGNQTLYVNLLRVVGDNTATGWVTASTFEPSMYALPIPA